VLPRNAITYLKQHIKRYTKTQWNTHGASTDHIGFAWCYAETEFSLQGWT